MSQEALGQAGRQQVKHNRKSGWSDLDNEAWAVELFRGLSSCRSFERSGKREWVFWICPWVFIRGPWVLLGMIVCRVMLVTWFQVVPRKVRLWEPQRIPAAMRWTSGVKARPHRACSRSRSQWPNATLHEHGPVLPNAKKTRTRTHFWCGRAFRLLPGLNPGSVLMYSEVNDLVYRETNGFTSFAPPVLIAHCVSVNPTIYLATISVLEYFDAKIFSHSYTPNLSRIWPVKILSIR